MPNITSIPQHFKVNGYHVVGGGKELYGHANDPNEWTTLADRPELDGVKSELRRWLPETDAQPRKKKRVTP